MSIVCGGGAFHGTSVSGYGVFVYDGFITYAGQHRGGFACGLGVATWSQSQIYGEHDPDGNYHGRYVDHWNDGGTGYWLYERGEPKDSALVFADGRCLYDREDCAPDDPRLLALIAQVAPVEVRRAAPATHPPSPAHSPPSNRPLDQPARFAPAGARHRRGHQGAPPTPHAGPGGRMTPPKLHRIAVVVIARVAQTHVLSSAT
jgi:hypothetical protein